MRITNDGLDTRLPLRISIHIMNRMRFDSFVAIFMMVANRHLLGFLVLLCYFLQLHPTANATKGNCPRQSCRNLGLFEFPLAKLNSSQCDIEITDYQVGNVYSLILKTDAYESFWEVSKTESHLEVNRAFFRCVNREKEHPSKDDMSKFRCSPTQCLGDEIDVNQSGQQPNYIDPFQQIEEKLSGLCQNCHQNRDNLCDQKIFVCEDDKGPPKSSKQRSWKVLITGVSVVVAGITTIGFCAVLLLYKRRHNFSKFQSKQRNICSSSNSNTNTYPKSGNVYFGIPVFSYEELEAATNNFDQAGELGEGGFGIVYYGKLRDGREVAVKQLYERNYRPVESFINEIQILTCLRHRSLVSLYGCTSRHSRELLLVYEYVPNGTVSYHLHGDKSKSEFLTWPVRMKIAIETASALAYLHASDIVHRDVKTSNILLDNSFSVKVADFGLSRLFPNNVTHISTVPRGTPGYVDPEYRLCYQLTSKSDVYSFGVVLVELISSLPAVDMSRERDEIKLANLALRKIQKGEICELVDPNLGVQSDEKSRRMVISVAKLAFQCLQEDKDSRPSMCEVLEVLQRIESGEDEQGNLEGIEVHGAGVSFGNSHPLFPNTATKPKRLHQTL